MAGDKRGKRYARQVARVFVIQTLLVSDTPLFISERLSSEDDEIEAMSELQRIADRIGVTLRPGVFEEILGDTSRAALQSASRERGGGKWGGRRKHVCSICATVAPWSDAWCWYGSYRQIDDGEPVVKLCSPACKTEFARRRKLASIARVRARREAALAMRGLA